MSDDAIDPLKVALFDIEQLTEGLNARTSQVAEQRKCIAELRAEVAELEQLFDLQHTRMVEATQLWRLAHPGNDLVAPDLGVLLEWLMERIKDE